MIAATLTAMQTRLSALLPAVIPVSILASSSDFGTQIQERVRKTSAVMLAFMGGTRMDDDRARIDAEFIALVVVSSVSLVKRADGPLGMAHLVELVGAALHGLLIPEAGSLTLANVANLWADDLDKQGLSLFALTFRAPLPLVLADDPTINLAALVTVHSDWIIDDATPVPPAAALPLADSVGSITVTLPQEVP